MAKKKRAPRRENPGPVTLNRELLETLMMDYAERRSELEAPLLNIARQTGLTAVVDRIMRLRSYAKRHRSK